jgi:hypothetical protein
MAHNEGLTWISRRTGQLRYSANGTDQWLNPLSTYTAGETIRRGELVSMATAADVTELSLTAGGDNYIVLTRTLRHSKCVGIAMEYATAGNPIHLIPVGKFRYDLTKSTVLEANPGWLDTDRGAIIYAGPANGGFTLDPQVAVLNGRSMITVGFIANTQTTYTDIEIQFERDGRGPLEATQFEVSFGEPTSFKATNGGPPIKVFAVGSQAAAPFQYGLGFTRPQTAWPTTGAAGYNSWLAVYSANYARILVFGPSTTPVSTTADDASTLATILSFATQSTVAALYPAGGTTAPVAWGSPWSTSDPLYTAASSQWVNTILTAINLNGATPIPYLPETNGNVSAPTVQPTLDTSSSYQASVLALLQGAINGGPVYVAWDSSLDRFFRTSSVTNYGSYGNQGAAVLASSRDPARQNILGFYLGTTTNSLIPVGTRGIFLNKGSLTLPYAAFTPGAAYYLGQNGTVSTISPAVANYTDALIKIGVAQTVNTLLVDPQQAMQARVADYPVGSLKPLPAGSNIAEFGFLLANGTTSYLVSDYPELNSKLLQVYPASLINPVNNLNFVIPAMANPALGNWYQIKASTFGYEPMGPNTVVIRSTGVFPAAPVGGKQVLPAMDITAFASIGPQGISQTPSMDRVLPKLYVQIGSTGTTSDWREITEGMFLNNGALYGFKWVINQTGSGVNAIYSLGVDIGNGGGIALPSTPTTLISIANDNYAVAVYRGDVLARYSEYDLDIGKVTLSALNRSSKLPVSSTAVQDWVNASISTQALEVETNTTLGNSANSTTTIQGSSVAIGALGAAAKLTITNATGVIVMTTPQRLATVTNGLATANPVNGALINAQMLYDHQAETITSAITVHGIRQGAGNSFDADKVDGYQISNPATPTVSVAQTGTAFVPYVDANTSGQMKISTTIRMMNVAVDRMTIDAQSTANALILKPGNVATTAAGLGLSGTSVANALYLWNDGLGNLNVQNTAGTFMAVKAAAFNTASALALKEDVEEFRPSALDIINKTQIVKYRYKGEDKGRVPHVGFIADVTHELMAGAAHDSMDLASTVGLLLKAVQELSSENVILKQTLKKMAKKALQSPQQ